MLPLLTHNLSVTDFGLWDQVAVGIALIVPWVSLQLSGAFIRFLPGQQDNTESQEIFYSIFLFASVSSALFSLSLWAIAPFLHAYPNLEPFLEHAGIISMLVPLSTMVGLIIAYFRALRLMVRHSVLTLGQNFGEIALVSYALFSDYGLGGALLALAIARSALVVLGGTMVATHLGLRCPTFRSLKTHLLYSLPLIPNSAFYRIFDAGDRYILSYFMGNAAVGIYAAAYTVSSLFTTLLSPLHLVLLPAMAELWNTQRLDELKIYITQTIRYSFMILLPFLAGILLFPIPLLHQLAPQTYGEAVLYLPILSVSFLLLGLGIPGNHVLVTAGRTRLLLFINIGVMILNIGLNILLIPQIGIFGAVFSTFLGQTCYSGLLLVSARRIVHFDIPWKAVLHYTTTTVAMAILLNLTVLFYPLPIFIVAALGLASYFIMLYITGGISRQEIHYLYRLSVGK